MNVTRSLMLFVAFACTNAVADAKAATPLTLPPLHYVQRVLPNGLQVLIVEDHRTPTVALFVAYRVGGKNDPPKHSGFATSLRTSYVQRNRQCEARVDRPLH